MTSTNLGMDIPVNNSDLDDWGLKLIAAFALIDTFAGGLLPQAEVTVASATTTDIGAAASTAVAISGTTTITGLGTGINMMKFLRFTGTSLVLTYNATSLITPTAANIQAAAGDTCIALADASGHWRIISYTRGAPPVQASSVAVGMVGGATANLATISVPAGKWRLSGIVQENGSGAPSNAYVNGAISANSASYTGTVMAKSRAYGANYCPGTPSLGSVSISGFDVTLTTTTTYYLVATPLVNSVAYDGYIRADPII